MVSRESRLASLLLSSSGRGAPLEGSIPRFPDLVKYKVRPDGGGGEPGISVDGSE
jgi:hypothetical protein